MGAGGVDPPRRFGYHGSNPTVMSNHKARKEPRAKNAPPCGFCGEKGNLNVRQRSLMEKIDLDNYSMYVVKAIHMPYPDRPVELPLEVVARNMQEARELVFASAEYPVRIEGVFYHSTARAFYEEIYGPLNEEEEKQIEKQIAWQVSMVR